MSRRQDAATATVGGGLTATGGYLRHAGVQDLIRAQGGRQPKVHGLAIARHGTRASRKLYGAGALVGLIGAPALAIGGTKFVRGEPVGKRDKPSFLSEGIKGTGDALLERKETLSQKVPAKARAAGYATTASAGGLGVLAARGLLRHKGGGAKALISPVAGVLAGAAATPLSSRVVQHVTPGYEVTPSGVRRKKKALKRASSASYQHRNIPRSFQSDIAKALSDEEYEMEAESLHIDLKQLYRATSPKHKGYWARQVLAGLKYYESIEEYDLAEDCHEALAEVMSPGWYRKHVKNTGRTLLEDAATKRRNYKRDEKGRFSKDASSRKYRAKVTAAGAIPMANYALQPLAAGHGITDPGHRHRAEASQATATIGGDTAGVLAGGHAAAYAAKHSESFRRGAEQANNGIESMRSKIGLQPKVIKPAAAANTRTGKIIRGATKPFHGKYGVAAGVGALAGTMTIGNTAQQMAISHNLKHNVGKAVTTPGMTPREQQKQLKRKARLIAINTMGATTGAAGLAAYGASKHPGLIAHKPQLEGLTLGLGALGGGIGSYAGFKRAKVEHRDLKAQRKALGVAKAFQPLRAPSGHPIMRANKMLRADDTAWTRSRKKQVLGGKYRPDDLMQAPPNWYYGRVHHLADMRQGVSKGMPDQSELATPAGLLKAKTYTSSSYRRKPSTGQLVRVKAGLR